MAEGEVRQYFVRNDRGKVWGPLTLPTIELLLENGLIPGRIQVSEDGLKFAFPGRFPDIRHIFPKELWGDAAAEPSEPPPAPAAARGSAAPARPAAQVPAAELPQEDVPPAQGDLATRSAVYLYGLLAAGNHTGALTLKLADRTLTLHFRKGNPDFIDSSHPDDGPGVTLMRAGIINPQQLQQAEGARERFGGDIMGALFGLGLLQPASAFAQLAQRAQAILLRALRAESGTFTYEAKELPASKAMPLGNRWGVLSEMVRNIPAAELRQRLQPYMDVPVMKSTGRVAATDLRLTPQEVRALGNVDGVRSLSRLMADFPQEAERYLSLVFLLKELGAVAFAGTQARSAPPPPPPPQVVAARPAPAQAAGTPAQGTAAARPPQQVQQRVHQPPPGAPVQNAAPPPPPRSGPPRLSPVQPATGAAPAAPTTPPPIAAAAPASPAAPPPSAAPRAPVPAAAGAAPRPTPPNTAAAPRPPVPGAAPRPPTAPGTPPPATSAPAAPAPARPVAPAGAAPRPAGPAATAPAAAPVPPRPAAPAAPRPAAPTAPAAAAPAEDINALRQLATKLKDQNYFERLGLATDANGGAVKMAYFKLAKLYHPDTIPPGSPPELEKVKSDIFAYIGEAYRALSDDKGRSRYVEDLKTGNAGGEVDVQAILKAEETFQKGSLLVKARRFAEAAKMFEEAIQLNPEEAEFYAWRGYARFFTFPDKKAGFTEAYKDIQLCLKKNERCAQAHYFHGVLAKLCGDAAGAVRHFQRTVELQPNHIDAQREIRLAQQRK